MKVFLNSNEVNQPSETASDPLQPISVMFPYTFLEVAGTTMEKKLNKFQFFFDVCSGSPAVEMKCFH